MSLMLLDYGNTKPFGETVGRERHLAWPVNAYRVTLPKPSEDGESLNPFERVILKLIDAGGSPDAEQLAADTCLPSDLTQCVLLRLRDKAYIDEHNQINDQQRKRWQHDQDVQREFATAILFRELATGRILPFLHVLGDDHPLKQREEERFVAVLRADSTHAKRLPEARDVISALRGMQRRSRSFGREMRLPSIQQVTVAVHPELCHLDCPIAIQKSDGEFRIGDPFGNGFSLVLESAFRQLLEQDTKWSEWLLDWRMSLSNPRQELPVARQREPFDNDANWGRYRNLISTLRIPEHEQYRSIDRIHAAIEWALFYCCAQREYTPAIHQLRLAALSEHPALLLKAAEEIALEVPPGGLYPVKAGKLDDFLSGKAELGTVLSLALVMAATDRLHPVRHIAAMHHDLILRLFKIKGERDDPQHGKGKVRLKAVESPEEPFMREVVSALLPTMHFSDSPVAKVDQSLVADSLMDARTSIQGEFGFALFNRLGINQQHRLINAERFWLTCTDGDDAIAFACDVYAALQNALRRPLAGSLPPDIKESDYSLRAQERADECGFGKLPDCLLTVKRSAIRETLQGNDQSLQSCVVALLLIADSAALEAIACTQPSFITDIAHVIDVRGHGNEPLPLPRDSTRKLRTAAYTTLKTLLEV